MSWSSGSERRPSKGVMRLSDGCLSDRCLSDGCLNRRVCMDEKGQREASRDAH